MIDIYIKGQLAITCLPELVSPILQSLLPMLGVEFKIETKQHVDTKAKDDVK